MPELRISTEKVCAFIETAREVAGKVASTSGDRTTTGDDSKLETIVDEPGQDFTRVTSEGARWSSSSPVSTSRSRPTCWR